MKRQIKQVALGLLFIAALIAPQAHAAQAHQAHAAQAHDAASDAAGGNSNRCYELASPEDRQHCICRRKLSLEELEAKQHSAYFENKFTDISIKSVASCLLTMGVFALDKGLGSIISTIIVGGGTYSIAQLGPLAGSLDYDPKILESIKFYEACLKDPSRLERLRTEILELQAELTLKKSAVPEEASFAQHSEEVQKLKNKIEQLESVEYVPDNLPEEGLRKYV